MQALKVLVLFISSKPIHIIACGSVVGSKCFCARCILEYSEEEEVCGSWLHPATAVTSNPLT